MTTISALNGIQPPSAISVNADTTGATAMTVAQAIALFKKTPGAAPVQITDTSATIARNLDALQALGASITSITQTGTASALAVTDSQLTSDAATLAKIQGSYTLAVSGVAVTDAATVLANSNVAHISIADSSANIASGLDQLQALGTKVTAITQTGTKTPLSVSVGQIASDAVTLSKIDSGRYTLNVSDTQSNIAAGLPSLKTLGTRLGSITLASGSSGVFALSMAQFTSFGSIVAKIQGATMAITDTTANVFKGLSSLQALNSSVASITLSDPGTTVTTSAKAMGSDSAALGKITSGYNLAVTDTGASIAANIGSLAALNGHIASITQTDSKTALALTATQYTNDATTLAKINGGNYTAALSQVSRADLSSLSGDTKVTAMNLTITDGDLTGLTDSRIKTIALSGASLTQAIAAAADKRVTSIAVSDAGANFTSANVEALYSATKANLSRVTSVQANDATRQTLNVSLSDYETYAKGFLSKFNNMALQVDFTGSKYKGYSNVADTIGDYNVVANSNGSFNIQQWEGKWVNFATLGAGVNFIKFSDKTTFLDTGSADLNSLLYVGTQNWRQSATNPNASTSSTQLAPGVFSLASGSAPTVITFSFFTSASQTATSQDANGFQQMSATQQSAVYQALNYYSSLINVDFEYVSDPTQADIRFGTNNQGTASDGYASGGGGSSGPENAVFLNNSGSAGAVNANLTPGTYGWEALLHEIGHTMGLKHPGAYNAGDGSVPPGPYLPKALDNRRTSVMSYNNPTDDFNWGTSTNGLYTGSYVNPSTLMPEDILALQFLYGRNTSGQSTSDVQNGASDPSVTGFETTTFDSSWMGLETLDSSNAGVSLNLSSVSNSNIVDLRAGAYSSINILPSSFDSNVTSSQKQTFFNYNNVGLADDSAISSVVGGSGNDVFYVTDSNATIDGGGGTNELMLYGNATEWTQTAGSNGATIYTNEDGTQITASNIEAISYYNEATKSTLHSSIDLTV